jgi:hypothetical protein
LKAVAAADIEDAGARGKQRENLPQFLRAYDL